jgi:hypothetical protein
MIENRELFAESRAASESMSRNADLVDIGNVAAAEVGIEEAGLLADRRRHALASPHPRTATAAREV